MQKNGEDWFGKTRSTTNTFSISKMNIKISTIDNSGAELERLSFIKVPKQIGRYPLSYTFDQAPSDSMVGCLYSNGSEDELFDSYLLAKNDSTSYIEIIEYDKKSGELKGQFNLILWPDIKGSWNAPDSIVFSNGVFTAKLQN